MSPDDKYVYGFGQKDHAITLFARNTDQTDSTNYGTLTYQAVYKNGESDGSGSTINGIGVPSDITMSSGGKYVYIVGSRDNALAVFGRNSNNGTLTFIKMYQNDMEGVNGFFFANNIEINSAEDILYVAGSASGSTNVAIFGRNVSIGQLFYNRFIQESSKMLDTGDMVTSTDGLFLYVADKDGKGNSHIWI